MPGSDSALLHLRGAQLWPRYFLLHAYVCHLQNSREKLLPIQLGVKLPDWEGKGGKVKKTEL